MKRYESFDVADYHDLAQKILGEEKISKKKSYPKIDQYLRNQRIRNHALRKELMKTIYLYH